MSTNRTSGATSCIDSEGRKEFLPLENNPSILNPLAHAIGLKPTYSFHDLYSFTDPDLLSIIPRPALALLFVWPCTAKAESWHSDEVRAEDQYEGTGEEPVLWFKQIVVNACGLMGTIHCTLNAHHALPPNTISASTEDDKNSIIERGSTLAQLRRDANSLAVTQRADLVRNSDALETHHAAAAVRGDTAPPALGEHPGHAFIAFVKGSDGVLYELDGARKGPKMLGQLKADEDLLSERALVLSVRPYLAREEGEAGMGMEFSCTVLAPTDF